MIYYGIITMAVMMFSVQFYFRQIFQKDYGSDLQATLVLSVIGGIFGLVALLAINGLAFEYTHFTMVMAIISSLNALGFSFCSLKALGKINLSLYSVFSMLGGMALPFAAGILFFDETLTLGKIICFIIITVALFLTVEKGEKKSGTLYYAGIFVLNGMSGVISKIYQALPFEKASASGYSALTAVVGIVMAVILLFVLGYKKRSIKLSTVAAVGVGGILGRVANWLLLVALVHLPASAQYPFVTGGVMILSTILCYFTPKKPTKKEWASVILSFIGLLILVFIP